MLRRLPLLQVLFAVLAVLLAAETLLAAEPEVSHNSAPLASVRDFGALGDGTARIVMAGPGPAIKLLGTHAGSADPKDVKAEVWQRQRMPMVDGLEIVGAHPEATGIEADGTMQLTVTRVSIRECLHGIHLVRLNRNVIVANCHVYHNRGVGTLSRRRQPPPDQRYRLPHQLQCCRGNRQPRRERPQSANHRLRHRGQRGAQYAAARPTC